MISYLKEYSKTVYPFHMPGHKMGRLAPIVDVSPYAIDVTEVDGTDNLHHPEGIIKEAQDRASKIYGSRETFFLVNGSSSGLISAISACSKPDGEILIARNCHKSVYHGVYMNRLKPVYLYPQVMEAYGLLGGIAPEQVEAALMANPQVGCVVITSPTFEGFTSDIVGIAEVVHRHSKILIVDEAHGAHFAFDDRFPKSALLCGADLVIHSVHKTLPAFTQSALLHVGSERVDLDRLKFYLSIYQTTSPSYVLMAGIDECLNYMSANKEELFRNHFQYLDDFYKEAAALGQFRILTDEVIGRFDIVGRDPSKIVFTARTPYLFDGKQVEEVLRQRFNIQVEMATQTQILAMATVADTREGFDRLIAALKEIDMKMPCPNWEKFDIMNITSRIYDPFAVEQMEKVLLDLADCRERIAAGFVVLYPPGIPILVPGEKITGEILGRIRQYITHGLTVQGVVQDRLWVIEKG